MFIRMGAMGWRLGLLAAVTLVVVTLKIGTLDVGAQERPDRGDPSGSFGPGPFGPGPFGPGRDPGQGPGQGMNSAGRMEGLLRMRELHDELALTDSQRQVAQEIADWFGDKTREAWDGFDFGEMFELSEAERRQRMEPIESKLRELRSELDARLAKSWNVDQTKRLRQLQLQQEGLRGLLRADIRELLQVTDEQRSKLEGIAADSPPPFVPPEIRRESEEAALAVLTPEQKEKWQAQLGKLFDFPPPEFGPGFGPPGGPGGPFGGPGGPNREERRILKQFDTNHDGWLNQAERVPARQFAKEEARNAPRGRRGGFGGPPGGPGGPPGGPGGRGPGGRRGGRGPGRDVPPPSPGPPVSPQDVVSSNAPLYEPTVLRTLFLEFENSDWEAELADFHGTDVDVPAKLTVDGKTYPHVGVHFRGMSSYMMVPAGSKRSLNLSLDLADKKQRLDGYKTMNLLNAHEDDSFMSSVLYSHIARQYMPAPRANLVRVVINGESWGVYANVQQFDKEFLKQNYHSTQGTRWKVSGSPGGGGGLDYLGDEIEPYRRRYEIKSDDDDAAWQKLINLCRVLDKTPAAQLEAALEPILDVDELLWFLALDNTLINCDGYWIRASDYSLYLDGDGKFHVVPHDMNEAFRPPMGPGMGGRGGRGGRFGFPGGPPPGGENAGPPPREAAPGGRRPARVDLDPLVGMDDARKPLRSKVLGIPAWRTRYLQNVRTIAEKSLDWNTLGPVVAQYRELVGLEIERDTRKLSTYEDFQRATSDEPPSSDHANPPDAEQPPRFGPATMNLRTFAEKRREYLLSLPSIRELAP